MIKRSMKVEFVDDKYILITGDRQTGKSTFANELALSYKKPINFFKKSHILPFYGKGLNYVKNDYILLLDEVEIETQEEENIYNKMCENAFKVIIVSSNNKEHKNLKYCSCFEGKKYVIEDEISLDTLKRLDPPKEPKEDVYVKISEETRKHLEELNELNEELKYASKLSRRYLSYSDSEITKKIKESIYKKEHQILVSLDLVKE